jgi:ATP-dependent protease ClpP protease subunit
LKVEIKGEIVPNDYKGVYDWIGWSATCPRDISDAIEKANGEILDVEINSPGGDVDSASEIYAALKGYSGTRIHIVGACASAASMVAMAGWSEMVSTGRMMVHCASAVSDGNHNVHDKTSEILQKADKAIASAYVAKSGMSEKDVLDMMDKTTWLTAQDAVDKKLVDRVMFAGSAAEPLAASASGLLPRTAVDKIRSLLTEKKQTEKIQTELDFLKEKVI